MHQVLSHPYGLSVRKEWKDVMREACPSPMTLSVLNKGQTGSLDVEHIELLTTQISTGRKE